MLFVNIIDYIFVIWLIFTDYVRAGRESPSLASLCLESERVLSK